LAAGAKLHYMTRHLMGLFNAQPGGKQFRRYVSENAYRDGADLAVLEQAMALVPE
jgi:tRNA-dihydrouridine synthase A